MDGIATSEDDAGDLDHVADFEPTDLVFGKGRFELSHSVKPLSNLAFGCNDRALAAVSPAHIRDADKEGCRQAIQRGYLYPHQCRLAAESHRSDAELIGLRYTLLLQ